MKINELSIIELKAYYDLINDKIKDTDVDITINGGNEEKFGLRSRLYILKQQFEKEVENKINEIEFK